MKLLFENWRKYLKEREEAPKPKAIPIKCATTQAICVNLSYNNYYFIIGYMHAVQPDEKNQKIMKIAFDLIEHNQIAGQHVAKEFLMWIKAAKKSETFNFFLEQGKLWTVVEGTESTRRRVQGTDPDQPEKVTRTETTTYRWKRK